MFTSQLVRPLSEKFYSPKEYPLQDRVKWKTEIYTYLLKMGPILISNLYSYYFNSFPLLVKKKCLQKKPI